MSWETNVTDATCCHLFDGHQGRAELQKASMLSSNRTAPTPSRKFKAQATAAVFGCNCKLERPTSVLMLHRAFVSAMPSQWLGQACTKNSALCTGVRMRFISTQLNWSTVRCSRFRLPCSMWSRQHPAITWLCHDKVRDCCSPFRMPFSRARAAQTAETQTIAVAA